MLALDPEIFAAVARLGPPALAWEVLRRNPAYQAAYAALSTPPTPGVAAEPMFAAAWGLHFR